MQCSYIHIIGAYLLAAASDKRMRLLTSLYGVVTPTKGGGFSCDSNVAN